MVKKLLTIILLSLSSTLLFGQQSALKIDANGDVLVKNKLDVSGEVIAKSDVTVTGTLKSSTTGTTYDPLPVGTILMFDGTNWEDNVTIPGWYACTKANYDNTNIQVPNLEDRFIMGSGSSAPKTSAGSNSKSLSLAQMPAHNHNIRLGNDTHSHTINASGVSSQNNILDAAAGSGYAYNVGSGGGGSAWRLRRQYMNNHAHTANNDTHNHTVYQDSKGSGAAIDFKPAFYTVIYIRKVN